MAKYIKTEEGYTNILETQSNWDDNNEFSPNYIKNRTHYDSREQLLWLVGNENELETITLDETIYHPNDPTMGFRCHIINVDISLNNPIVQITYYDAYGQLRTYEVNLPVKLSPSAVNYEDLSSSSPFVDINGYQLTLLYHNYSKELVIGGLWFMDGLPIQTNLSLCVFYEGELVKLDDKYISHNIARAKNVLTKINTEVYTPTDIYHPATKKYVDDIFQKIYPVGAIYLSMNSTSPASIFGGTWEQIEDRFLLGAGTNYAAGASGGATEHAHNTALQFASYQGAIAMEGSEEVGMVSYSADGTKTPNASTKIGDTSEDTSNSINAGSQSSKTEVESLEVYETEGNTSYASNMPPYLVVYMWKRIK